MSTRRLLNFMRIEVDLESEEGPKGEEGEKAPWEYVRHGMVAVKFKIRQGDKIIHHTKMFNGFELRNIPDRVFDDIFLDCGKAIKVILKEEGIMGGDVDGECCRKIQSFDL